jgi:MFS family permease
MRGFEAMFAKIKPFIALYTAVIFMMTGIGLLNTYLGLRLSLEGVSTHKTGLVLTTYFIGLIVGTFYCRRIIRSVGHIRAHCAFVAVTASLTLIHGLVVSAPLWAAFRFFSGVANMGLFMVIESWLSECAESEVRGRIFSIYMIMAYLGAGTGQKILGIGDALGQTVFLVAGIFLILSIIPVAVTHTIHPTLPEMEQFSLKTIYRKAPIGMLCCFITGLNNSAFYAMGSVFAHKIGLNISQVSWFMTLGVLGGLVFQWPVGSLSDRLDRSLMLPFQGAALTVVAGCALFIGFESVSALLCITTVFGGILFSIYPVAVARAHDIFKARDVVKVSSALLLCMGMGTVLGPMLVSLLMTVSGTPLGFFVYYITTGSLLFAATLLLRQRESVKIIPPDQQVDFVIMKKTSSVAMQMDPRRETH